MHLVHWNIELRVFDVVFSNCVEEIQSGFNAGLVVEFWFNNLVIIPGETGKIEILTSQLSCCQINLILVTIQPARMKM